MTADPRCPDCGEPVGQTATYCMHCSAEFDEPVSAGSADDSGVDDSGVDDSGVDDSSVNVSERVTEAAESLGSEAAESLGGEPTTETDAEPTRSAGGSSGNVSSAGGSSANVSSATGETERSDDGLLADDGLVDDTLTMIVGVVGGLVVGLIGTSVLLATTGSLWALLVGFLGWLFTTAYLVRRRTAQEAVSKAAYALSLVFLSVPVVTLSPFASVEGGLTGRATSFGIFLVVMLVPAAVAALIGWIAGRFVPDAGGNR